MEQYDIVILGGGIAGLTAAVYGVRAGLKTLVLEKNTCGGLANWAIEIENFPSHEKIGGQDLMTRIKSQALNLGVEIREIIEVEGIQLEGRSKEIKTDDGIFYSKTIIVASGREPIPLSIMVDSDHIHYCAICDGTAYRGKDVLVVGGGNSGVCDALYLLNQGVGGITLIEQMDRLFAAKVSQEALLARPEVNVMTSTEVCGLTVDGDSHRVTLRNTQTAARQEIEVRGIFVYIGQVPHTSLFKGILELDEQGYIQADETMHTNLEGVFVAGDVRRKKYRQLTTAMNDGTIAALEAEEYIHKNARMTK
jgi:thioredoxin reductase (NADPH)